MPFFQGGIGPVTAAYGVHMEHPARTEQPDRVVELRGHKGQLVRRGTGRILPPDFPGRQKRAVFVENDARRDQGGVGEQIRQPFGSGAVVFEFQHLKPPTARQRLALAG